MKIIGENGIFDILQGHQITDEELYITEGNIPVLTGNNEIKGYWDKSIVTEDQLPCITYPTKGNPGVAYIQDDIFDANNTAVLIPKLAWRGKISLEWVAYKLASLFPSISTSKEGVSYLNKDIIADIDIELPSDHELEKQIEFYREITKKRNKLIQIRDRIDKMLEKHIEIL